MKLNTFIKYIAFVLAICSVCLVFAVGCKKKEDNTDPNALNLIGTWADIMTGAEIRFAEDGSLYIYEDSYPYTYSEEKQAVYVTYMGGYILTLECRFEDGYWKLYNKGDGYTYVQESKRAEIRAQEIAEKWGKHTADRTEVVVGQTYTTADGTTFTLTGGNYRNTPEYTDYYGEINLYITSSAEISLQNWLKESIRTPNKYYPFSAFIQDGGEGQYVVTCYQNIGGTGILGKEPHDYCIYQFEFGGSRYYVNVLNLELIEN